jgi:MEMO1 family protein
MRKSTIAGSWYPGSKEKLKELVSRLLAEAQLPALTGRTAGLISPHAGIQFSGSAAAFGFKALQGQKVRRVILMGPSHYTYIHGIAVSGVSAYETPLGKVPVDRTICDGLAEMSLFQGPAHAELPEHSLEMQLPFLQVVLGEFDLVPLVVGELERTDYDTAAAALKQYCTTETVVVASSDFTHYGPRFGYTPFHGKVKENLAKLDGDAIKKITARDTDGFLNYIEQTGATICGSRPIGILLKLLPPEALATKLTYYTSGDLLQDFTDSVSYASVVFTIPSA